MMRVPNDQGQIRILFGCPLQARWDWDGHGCHGCIIGFWLATDHDAVLIEDPV